MESIANPLEFSEQTFGQAKIGDSRRTKRLVDVGAALAKHPGASIPVACEGNSARLEGTYKLIRNTEIEDEEIRQAVFSSTAAAANKETGDLLLIQDTTSISPVHALRDELRSKQGSPSGYEVHSGLLVDATNRVPIGMLGQLVWNRKPSKSKEKLLPVESAKWQRLDEQTYRQDINQARLIRIADRESDFYEYIQFLVQRAHRFVLRAAQDRRIQTAEEWRYLWQAAQHAPVVGTRMVTIEQRGGQKKGLEQSARDARPRQQIQTTLRATRVEIKSPKGHTTVAVNCVYVSSEDGALEWLLLTQESIATAEQVACVVGYYECRWLIERFHKSWKSGCKIEERRMGSLSTYLRMMAITMPIAVRLLRLQILANMASDSAPATKVLTLTEVQALWAKVEQTAFPEEMPSCFWAYRSIAKIAGWTDSKRTGRIGIDTLWRGYHLLAMLAEGWAAAQKFSAMTENKK